MSDSIIRFTAILAAVAAIVLVGEGVKLAVFPDMGAPFSYAVTIVLSALSAALAGHFVARARLSQVTSQAVSVEEARRESDKLHRFFIDNIDEGAFLIENAKITDVSTVGAEMLGYGRDELVGQAPTFVVSQRAKDEVRRRVREGNEEPYESEGQRKDGSTFPVLVHGRELVYEGRRVRLTTLQDISARKQSEETLRKLSRAVDQNPSAVFITDTEGVIEYVNAKFEEITGYTAQEAIGQNPRILKSDSTPVEVYADLWRTIQAGHDWRHEIQDRRKDGSFFWAYATIAPVKNSDNEITHYIATHEDITRRKEAEASAMAALDRADVANRAKSELLANMSHELRTPLNAIIGFSDTINAEVFGPLGHDKYGEYIRDIHDSGVHLLQLVNDILDVSAIEAGRLELRKERLDCAELVEASMRLVKHRAEARAVRLGHVVADGLPQLYADQRRVKQILLNLLSNAIKFTPSGGAVDLTISFYDGGCDGGDDGGRHVICVADNGIGMSAQELAKAMTQFGQVDSSLARKQEGTGLGLPLTKGLVELHGGVLDVHSEPGVGTTVRVTFPNNSAPGNSANGPN